MDASLLKVLTAFAESSSLVEAAERLKITQPAVSQRLGRLQEYLPQPLYAFEGRRKVLTHYGKALYELAKDNEAHLATGLENLNRRYSTGAGLVMRVGGRKELFGLLSQTLGFEGRLELQQMETSQALLALERDELDIALTDIPAENSDLISRKILDQPSRLIFNRSTFPGLRTFRELQSLKEKILSAPGVFHKTENHYFERLARGLKLDPKAFQRKAMLEDWVSLVALVEQGVGYSVVPGFVPFSSKRVESLEIPHAVIARASYFVVFHRKLRKVEAFQKALSFSIQSS